MRIIGIGKLFIKKPKSKPTAAVFVDYEHWYISITKLHGIKPNIKSWAKELSKKYEIKYISFFGDFSNPSLAAEILKIRAVTNNIIQTSNTGNYKKDFTDFIMLDHIYQKAMFSNDIDAFIIFSGDGHFSSAASCLKNNCKKEVGIFGVKDAFSNQLKEIASWFKEIPTEFDVYEKYFNMIFTNLKDVERTGRSSRPSFAKTAEHVSELYGVEEEKIKEALNILIDNGYAKRKETTLGRKKIMVLDFDWDKIEADDIWIKDHNLKRKEISEDKENQKSPQQKNIRILKPETKSQEKGIKVLNPEIKKEKQTLQKKSTKTETLSTKKTSPNKKKEASKNKSQEKNLQKKERHKIEAKKSDTDSKTINKASGALQKKNSKPLKKETPFSTAESQEKIENKPRPAKKKRRYYPPKKSAEKKETLNV